MRYLGYCGKCLILSNIDESILEVYNIDLEIMQIIGFVIYDRKQKGKGYGTGKTPY